MDNANPLKFVGRRYYAWAMVILFVVAPALELGVFQLVPGAERYSRYINTSILMCIVLFTGARLADAGYRRWIGITVMLAIGVGIPAIAGLAYSPARLPQISFDTYMLGVIAIVMALSLSFVVWAGTRKSVPRLAGLDDGLGETRTESRRIEPHF